MSVRMRHTREHTSNRRSHHALNAPRLSKCSKCSEMHLRHRMCGNCGTYKGKEIVDVLAKVMKKEKKMKAKMNDNSTKNVETQKKEDKPLNAEELSNK